MPDPKIRLHSGEYFHFYHPETCSFQIEDIAHSLAHICRFNGHTPKFYSVAEHSYYVAHQVPSKLRLTALLHDASEAFLGDVVKPLKNLLPDYHELELATEKALAKRFGTIFPLPDEIKQADLQMLVSEQRYLLKNEDPWVETLGHEARQQTFYCFAPVVAKSLFLTHFTNLQGTYA